MNLILVMLNNGMLIIGEPEGEKRSDSDEGVTIKRPRMILLGQATQGISVSIQNIPWMFSSKVYIHAETIIAETNNGYIEEGIKKAYVESVSSIRIATAINTTKK